MPQGPAVRSRLDLMPSIRRRGVDIPSAWQRGMEALRGGGCSVMNGIPIDDLGAPASQWSESMLSIWNFVGASADDFEFVDVPTPVQPNCLITNVRTAFHFFNFGAEDASPTNTWQSVVVEVYPNVFNAMTNRDEPDGFPVESVGVLDHSGSIIAAQEIPVSQIQGETLLGDCSMCYQIDIPVSILVAKNTKYWLSIIPRHEAPPQSGWCLSQMVGGDSALQGLPDAGVAFWEPIFGNTGECPGAPPEQDHVNLAFTLTAVDAPDQIGACCDDTTGLASCLEGVSRITCQGPTQRFIEGGLCADFIPPCGTTDPGACCLPTGLCLDMLTPAQCDQAGGAWNMGDCMTVSCPPQNEECIDKTVLSGDAVSVAYDTTLAMTGAVAPATACGPIRQDVWFNYEVACDGVVTVHTIGSEYDTAIAIYGPGASGCPDVSLCPAADLTELACNDDFGAGTFSYLTVSGVTGNCLTIRVGGKDVGEGSSGGRGTLNVACIVTGEGACCHADGTCEVLSAEQCVAVGDIYSDGQPCTVVTCAEPITECCRGDVDDNCAVEELDIPGFVDSLLEPPPRGTIEFCRLDVSQDGEVNGHDVQPFIAEVLAMTICAVTCCPGDTNNDGFLNGLDLQGLISAVLSRPPCGTPAFCHADVNQDFSIDLLDVDEMVSLVLSGGACPPP